jgi:hypothetical protein
MQKMGEEALGEAGAGAGAIMQTSSPTEKKTLANTKALIQKPCRSRIQ